MDEPHLLSSLSPGRERLGTISKYLHWRELPFDRLRANVFSLPFLYPELVDAYFEIVSY